MSSARVIAEIGANHLGQLDTAKRMIEVAASCGVWGVKGQIRGPDYLHHNLRSKPYKNENSFGDTYGEHRDFLEFKPDEHYKLHLYANGLGLKYGVSIWDEWALEQSLSFDFLKIPSAESVNLGFCKKAHSLWYSDSRKDPLFVSFGISDATTKYVDSLQFCVPMVCTSKYPCPEDELHLCSIKNYLNFYEEVGFSDHSRGISMSTCAVALGATWIERHFTLDRTMKGTDQSASLEPQGLKKLCRNIEHLESALKPSKPYVADAERKLVRTAVALKHLEKGDIITLDDVRFQACGVGTTGLTFDLLEKGVKVAHKVLKGDPIICTSLENVYSVNAS